MKSPPLQFTDDEAQQLTETFITGAEAPKIKPRKTSRNEQPRVAVPLPAMARREARTRTKTRPVEAVISRTRTPRRVAELKKN